MFGKYVNVNLRKWEWEWFLTGMLLGVLGVEGHGPEGRRDMGWGRTCAVGLLAIH